MLRFLLPLCLVSCGDDGGLDSGPVDPECGDLDGDGTDTGNLPNVLGSWTVTLESRSSPSPATCKTANSKTGSTAPWKSKESRPTSCMQNPATPKSDSMALRPATANRFLRQHQSDLYGSLRASFGDMSTTMSTEKETSSRIWVRGRTPLVMARSTVQCEAISPPSRATKGSWVSLADLASEAAWVKRTAPLV